ncbi:MAG: carbamoyltransferase [Deltaproteobacteria bacterium]|nr:carbamoyltransferase [Deltaproteobacteria bacterium]
MNVLGISAFYHDSAACLMRDGKVVAAASEERFTRKKHDQDFPINAIQYCLAEGKLLVNDIDYIGFYEKPFIKFKRLLFSHVACFPKSFRSFLRAMPSWLHEKLVIPTLIRDRLQYDGPVYMIEHHMSHAASAFLVSPFAEAALLTVDGVGEWSTATYGRGSGSSIEFFKEIRFPHSLGLLYTAFTSYLGFKVNSAEYKVMGLAPYGVPRFEKEVRELIDVADDGSFRLNMEYFAYHYGLRMTTERFHRLFGAPPRDPEGPLEQRDRDIAASIQAVTEDVMLKMARHLHQETKLPSLCMAGGVALNCVANGRIMREASFRDIFVQPAAGDAGGALGVAAYITNSVLERPREFVMRNAFLGPAYDTDEIRAFLGVKGAVFEELDREALLATTAKAIADQEVVGWFQGRMEFGPRALGARSILADARNPKNQDVVNLKIKFRESFRPFAPAVLEERAAEYFELDRPSPYMLLVAQAKDGRKRLPATTHVDGSARIQTVDAETNPLFYDLIRAFDRLTGTAVLINTSFNVRGEPIVCTPEDALRCFLTTGMDTLVIDRFVLRKAQQPQAGTVDQLPPAFALD